jgi:anaphase-promoting complex subunit 3
MWCSFEKICKLKPEKIEVGKYFSEINPKILMFNNNFNNNSNTTNNDNNNAQPLMSNSNNGFKDNLNGNLTTFYNNDNVNNICQLKKDDCYINLLKENESNDYNNNNNINNDNIYPQTINIFKNYNYVYNNTNHNNNLSKLKKGNLDKDKEIYNNNNNNNNKNTNKTFENNNKNNKNNNKNKTNINNNNKANNNNNINVNNSNNTFETFKQKTSKKSLKQKEADCEVKAVELNNNIINSYLKSKKEKQTNFTNISELLQIFGEILKNLSNYKCQDALDLINLLPKNHKNSGFILSYIAKAFFEMNKYKESEKYYNECLKIEPYKLEGIEYFSSCLWHLKDQYQLCNLANHVLEQSLFSPETWVVLGNFYSLQKEHEVALRFLGRAIQLNNYYAYAYTLCGHEHFANEAFNESKEYYSKAIAIDDK